MANWNLIDATNWIARRIKLNIFFFAMASFGWSIRCDSRKFSSDVFSSWPHWSVRSSMYVIYLRRSYRKSLIREINIFFQPVFISSFDSSVRYELFDWIVCMRKRHKNKCNLTLAHRHLLIRYRVIYTPPKSIEKVIQLYGNCKWIYCNAVWGKSMHAETAFIVPDVFGKLCGACIASETVTMWNNWNKKKKRSTKLKKFIAL